MRHGGNVLNYNNYNNGCLIDFSSNINPLGYPDSLQEALMGSMNRLIEYPDIEYRNLKNSVSTYLGCEKDQVVLGNGAVEIINNFSIIFNRVIVVIPCFSEYIERPLIHGKEVVKISLTSDFTIDYDLLNSELHEGDLLILGNPNNPTGKRIEKNLLIMIHELIIEKNAFLVLDEAFYEFCPFDYDSIELFKASRNVCVIRAATKFFALPGIRLGYGFTSKEIVLKYNSIALPWSINTFADSAGRVVLEDLDYIRRSKKYIAEQRTKLLTELKKMEIIRVFDTDSNFILIKLLVGYEDDLFDFLIKRGIMIRKASSFEGLDSSFIRIAIKSFENNLKLVENIREYEKLKLQCCGKRD